MAVYLPDLSRADILAAIALLDKGVDHNFHESTKFDLEYQGKRYAPKAVAGLAAEPLIGRSLLPEDFSGGEDSRCFRVLRNAGFEIKLKPSEKKYAVITENDISQWKDETGRRYHFPRRYRQLLPSGTEVIYYKGKQRNSEFALNRLSADPHYFALARIGEVSSDKESLKGDLYAEIVGFTPLADAVHAKQGDSYLESIPESKRTNYWRDGVRGIDSATYLAIRRLAGATNDLLPESFNDHHQGEVVSLESKLEGTKKERFVTVYERDPALRNAAIKIHGTRCCICGFDFGEVYGDIGRGFIHVHHLIPVATMDVPMAVNPTTDLAPVCANCHSIIHRRRDMTISVAELRDIVAQQKLVVAGS